MLRRVAGYLSVELFGLSLVGHLIVSLVDVVAEQPIDGEEDPRELVDGEHVVAVEIVESENEAFDERVARNRMD